MIVQGEGVGAGVGEAVGVGVGARVGVPVGEVVGDEVGAAVGLDVGAPEPYVTAISSNATCPLAPATFPLITRRILLSTGSSTEICLQLSSEGCVELLTTVRLCVIALEQLSTYTERGPSAEP